MYTLYPYQEDISRKGQKILMNYKMLYLALAPRSGKTPISLNIVAEIYPDAKILFITTKSAMTGINQVIQDFGFKLDIYIINYESLHKVEGKYDIFIIDEAHKNISKFPKPSKSWSILKELISDTGKVIFLSGTTHIESSSQLFHQLALSPYHSFSKYRNFYEWFNSKEHYKRPGLYGGYGIPAVKQIGYGKETADYSNTVNFENKFKPMMIKYALDDEDILPDIVIKYTQMSHEQSKLYNEMKSTGVTKKPFSIATNAAGRLSKLQQIANGTLIGEDASYTISTDKAELIADTHTNVPIFYKYKEEYEMLCKYIDKDLLYQIDSQNTGLDLSIYDEMVIYSLTFSGANFSQVLARITNTERKSKPIIYIYLTEGTLDKEIYERVSHKKDMNEQFIRS